MRVSAHAKINLHLRILGKRPDGFHNLETIFQEITLCDELTIRTSLDTDVRLTCSRADIPMDESNLVVRAAQLLHTVSGRHRGCHIDLLKKIPAGAGLGGGSSDAAATLMALNQLWELNLPLQRLAELAAHLGSDVPFFLTGGIALASGRGERLTTLPHTPHYTGVLLCPPLHVSTREVYEAGNFPLTKSRKNDTFIDVKKLVHAPERWQEHFYNDLESVVFQQHPDLQRWLEQLSDAGAFYVRMSGSGSSLYGLFETTTLAQTACDRFSGPLETLLFHPVNRSQPFQY